ncbi:MAG TPA: hypothetical protein PKD85_18490 [Saprospiraceae bacterium]|nr:hypothetical protein [Saprospiraceae bacterium]
MTTFAGRIFIDFDGIIEVEGIVFCGVFDVDLECFEGDFKLFTYIWSDEKENPKST